jgi:molecular chaperone GrpE
MTKKTKANVNEVVETSKVAETKTDQDAERTDEVAEATDPVARLQAKVESLEESLLRAKADYQNAQRRSAIQRSEAIRYANAELLRSLLHVIDDFDRSLAASESSDNLEALVEGVRLVYENFVKALHGHGLEIIEALHKPFDPSVHEAVMQQPSADHPPGIVLKEISKGYRLGDRVLRPAKVIVSKKMNDVGASDQPEGESKTKEQGDSNADV